MKACRFVAVTLVSIARLSEAVLAGTIEGTASPGAVVWASPTAAVEPAENGLPLTEIRNVNRSFDPALEIVPMGSSIRFSNEDPFFHSIFSTSDVDPFDLGFYSIGPGKTVSFPRSGVVRVRCHIHHTMHASIIVVDGPATRADARSGAFRLGGVASGTYVIHAWDLRTATEQNAPLVYPYNAKNLSLPQPLKP